MRSKQIHIAIAQGNNHFEICQKVGKGVRILHKSGARLQDSINQVLSRLASEPAKHRDPALVGTEPAA